MPLQSVLELLPFPPITISPYPPARPWAMRRWKPSSSPSTTSSLPWPPSWGRQAGGQAGRQAGRCGAWGQGAAGSQTVCR